MNSLYCYLLIKYGGMIKIDKCEYAGRLKPFFQFELIILNEQLEL